MLWENCIYSLSINYLLQEKSSMHTGRSEVSTHSPMAHCSGWGQTSPTTRWKVRFFKSLHRLLFSLQMFTSTVELICALNVLHNSGPDSQSRIQTSGEKLDRCESIQQPAPSFFNSPFSVSRSCKYTIKSARSVIPLTDALLHEAINQANHRCCFLSRCSYNDS